MNPETPMTPPTDNPLRTGHTSPAPVDECRAFLAAHPNLRQVRLMLCDVNGVLRGKTIRPHELESLYTNGRPLPSSILGLSLHGDDVDETGLVWDTGDADCLAFPIASTLHPVPGDEEHTAQVMLTMHPVHGLPATHSDPRQVLCGVLERAAGHGLYPVVAGELEFYLLDADKARKGKVVPASLDGYRPQHTQVYSVQELEYLQPFLDDLYAACACIGIPAETAISEYAPGQFEITLTHREDALQALDEVVQYRHLIKTVALRRGMQACFMAKPFGEQSGSGMHMHVSLADADGNNLFADEHEQGTELLRQAIAGMMQTMADGMLIYAPHANSYRRFQANSYAPVAPTWGVNNRSVSLRVPKGPPASRHVEHRMAGADANLYLVAAAVLAGMLHGIENRLDPGAPARGDAYRDDAPEPAAPALPLDWLESIRRFEGSAHLKEMLGERFVAIYGAIKRSEYGAYQAEVSEQDYRWYLPLL